jgi:hypothetical protein
MEPDPPPQKLALRKAEFESVNEASAAGEPRSHDPMEMLRQNRAHEKAAGTVYDQSPAPVAQRSRRKRDYLVILVTMNGFFGCILVLLPNPILLFGTVFFSAALTWGMLVVIDDY